MKFFQISKSNLENILGFNNNITITQYLKKINVLYSRKEQRIFSELDSKKGVRSVFSSPVKYFTNT